MIQYEVPEPLILRKICVQGRKLLFLLQKYLKHLLTKISLKSSENMFEIQIFDCNKKCFHNLNDKKSVGKFCRGRERTYLVTLLQNYHYRT